MLESFNEKSKDVILSCDGKLIRRALTESSGDVDLQGVEHGSSLIERQNIFRAELDIVGKGISKHYPPQVRPPPAKSALPHKVRTSTHTKIFPPEKSTPPKTPEINMPPKITQEVRTCSGHYTP